MLTLEFDELLFFQALLLGNAASFRVGLLDLLALRMQGVKLRFQLRLGRFQLAQLCCHSVIETHTATLRPTFPLSVPVPSSACSDLRMPNTMLLSYSVW